MGKKYVPSGYQIIYLDFQGKTSGQSFDPETEDEKVLFSVLLNENAKPIYLTINTDLLGKGSGFVIKNGSQIWLNLNDYLETVYVSGNQLLWKETEL